MLQILPVLQFAELSRMMAAKRDHLKRKVPSVKLRVLSLMVKLLATPPTLPTGAGILISISNVSN